MFLLDTDTVIYSIKGKDAVQKNLLLHFNDPIMLRVRAKISLHFRLMDLGRICSIRGFKTTGIAGYFEDFGVEDRSKPA